MITVKEPRDGLLRVDQVAEKLGISKRTVWRLASSGKLSRPVAIGRSSRWKPADVERFVANLTPGRD